MSVGDVRRSAPATQSRLLHDFGGSSHGSDLFFPAEPIVFDGTNVCNCGCLCLVMGGRLLTNYHGR